MNVKQLIGLARIPTLAATAVPLLVGAALSIADGRFDPLPWFDILVVALLMQVGTNAMNEYGDYRHGVDRVPSVGFAGIIVTGEVSAREVFAAAASFYGISLLLGTTLVLARGILMLLLGVGAIAAGILYSEGPLPVSSTPLGEPLVAIVMGPVEVISANLAASGEISAKALLYSIPVGLTVASILLANNLRDIEKDRQNGRRTLPVIMGAKHASATLLLVLVLAFVWSFPAFLFFSAPASVFLVWLAFPVALRSQSYAVGERGRNRSVSAMARLHLLIGALLVVSLLLPL